MSVFYRFKQHTSKLLVLTVLLLALGTQAVLAADSIQVVDGFALDVGQHTSLALDTNGNPVISYHNLGTEDLKLAHCDDPVCISVEPVTIPDTGDVGYFSSLELDLAGNPVISYMEDKANSDYDALMLVHCNDPKCLGGDESVQKVDEHDDNFPGHFDLPRGMYTSLELDSGGNPVISYTINDEQALMLAYCFDPNCDRRSISVVDGEGDVGFSSSLELDSAGNPVISYVDHTNNSLKLAHCNDPLCKGGGDSIQTVDIMVLGGQVGYTSLELDSAGNPVISYYDGDHGDLKLVHCNDPQCVPGGDAIQIIDSADDVGQYSSLKLNEFGNPVISYYDATHGDLKLAYCFDPNCQNVSIHAVDGFNDNVGLFTSLELDAGGPFGEPRRPVISYYDATNQDLKLAYCQFSDCHELNAYPCIYDCGDHVLTVQGNGDGRGEMDGDVINCSYDNGMTSGICNDMQAYGIELSVVAKPQQNTEFFGWTGCDSTTTTDIPNDTCHITLTSDRIITASFQR